MHDAGGVIDTACILSKIFVQLKKGKLIGETAKLYNKI
jgi:hypothetical protein